MGPFISPKASIGAPCGGFRNCLLRHTEVLAETCSALRWLIKCSGRRAERVYGGSNSAPLAPAEDLLSIAAAKIALYYGRRNSVLVIQKQ